MKRLISVLMVLIGIIMSIPLTYAEVTKPPLVDSVMVKPIPEKTVEGNVAHYVMYTLSHGMKYDNFRDRDIVYKWDFTVDASATVNAYNGSISYSGVVSTAPITGTAECYDVITGALIRVNTIQDRAWNTTISGVLYTHRCTPFNAYYPNDSVAMYYFIPVGMELLEPTMIVEDWVNWAVIAPPVQVYHSYMAEPVADQYNKYIVLGKEDGASLYWIAIQRYMYQYTNANTWEYEGQIITETFVLGNEASYGLVYQVPTALNDVSYYAYAMQITEFDLETGQYIRTQSYAGESLGQTITIDISNFEIDPTKVTSIAVYGVNFINNGNIINKATVSWAINPTFEQWKNDIKALLQSIQNALTNESEEVTIEQETDALNELASENENVKVTDEHGSEMKADEEAQEAFSKASNDIAQLEEPISFINEEIHGLYNNMSIVFIPVTVAMALGLLATILGRKRG